MVTKKKKYTYKWLLLRYRLHLEKISTFFILVSDFLLLVAQIWRNQFWDTPFNIGI